MGFFDNFEDTGGLNYVGAEEKAVLVKSDVPLVILEVWEGELGGEYPGPGYRVKFILDGEERAMSFKKGSVESRDKFLDAAAAWLADGNEMDPVYLRKRKQSFVFVDVNTEKSA